MATLHLSNTYLLHLYQFVYFWFQGTYNRESNYYLFNYFVTKNNFTNKTSIFIGDNFWINGCKPNDITHTISEGRPEKGMTPFKATLTEAQISQISTFILKSLVGSNPTNAKAVQGVECK